MAQGEVTWAARVRASIGALDLDVELEGGRRPVALVGPNGGGKTTLLRILAGAHRPRAGRVECQGRVLFDSEAGTDLPMEQRRVGYVPQGYGLFPHLTVLDNVAFGLSLGGATVSAQERRASATAMLRALGSEGLSGRSVGSLSGGEQQRVALARALVLKPALLLLDEPMAALDVANRRSVRRFVAERLAAWGRPCIVVTHDVRDVAALEAEVHVLQAGRIVQRGGLGQLRQAPGSEFVAEFVGASEAPVVP